ncbi:hypothetical protein P9112_003324 [Eukaryota sp. TZLM1-RC]
MGDVAVSSASGPSWSVRQKQNFFRALSRFGSSPIAISSYTGKTPAQCASYLAAVSTLKTFFDGEITQQQAFESHGPVSENSLLNSLNELDSSSQLPTQPLVAPSSHHKSNESPEISLSDEEEEAAELCEDHYIKAAELMNIPFKRSLFLIKLTRLFALSEINKHPTRESVYFFEANLRNFIAKLMSMIYPLVFERGKRMKKCDYVVRKKDVIAACTVLKLPFGLDVSEQIEVPVDEESTQLAEHTPSPRHHDMATDKKGSSSAPRRKRRVVTDGELPPFKVSRIMERRTKKLAKNGSKVAWK